MISQAASDLLPLRELRGVAGLPSDRSALRKHVRKAGYRLHRVPGPGGTELAVEPSSLPAAVRTALLQRSVGVAPGAGDQALWDEFARKPATVQARAERNLAIVTSYLEKLDAGAKPAAAVATTAEESGVSHMTVRRLLRTIDGRPRADWLPLLAPNYAGSGNFAPCDEEAWSYFRGLVKIAPPQRPLRQIYDDVVEAARIEGWSWPSYDTVLRRWYGLSAALRASLRSGREALAAAIPAQQRSVSHLEAMQIVNLDGRKADVFVRWPDGSVSRPIVIAVQDVYSRKFLGWRVSPTEDADSTKALLLDVCERYGLYDELRTDNSRAFNAQKIAGGARHRFRGKRKPDEPLGFLTMVGVSLGFARPRNGRAKPIERGFRDFARNIDTQPEFAGAYCGHRPDAKPEDFKGAAVPVELFERVLEREVAAHNARPGRRTEVCHGKLSFDEAFNASWAKRPRRDLTDDQRLFFRHDIAYLTPHRTTGELRRGRHRWWSYEHQDALLAYRGKKLPVLLDPEDLSRPVVVLHPDGQRKLCTLPCLVDGEFNNPQHARLHARGEALIRRAVRLEEKGQHLMTAAQMAEIRQRALEARPEAPPPVKTTNVAQPLFGVPSLRTPAVPVRVQPSEAERREREENFRRGLALLKQAKGF